MSENGENPKRSKGRSSSEFSRSDSDTTTRIESYNSPKTKHTNDNAPIVFNTAVFVFAFAVFLVIEYLIVGSIEVLMALLAFVLAYLLRSIVHVASQWEKIVILRFGKYHRTVGSGIYFTLPFIDHIALRADQRVQLTGFSAEETLTADLVPLNVDAAIFWVVWDAEKACLEVEDYYDSVTLAAQTALRDAIGRKSITEVVMQRVQLDAELSAAVEEKATGWGVSVLSVEIRDIVIPKELQSDMSAEAQAEREKDARIVLAEVESDIAHMLLEASNIYRENEIAYRLRSMHLLSESIKDSQGTIVLPSAYVEGFADEAMKFDATKIAKK
jgi:regulator of protease activity HflC (stomatin/prohibitin superfamily)